MLHQLCLLFIGFMKIYPKLLLIWKLSKVKISFVDLKKLSPRPRILCSVEFVHNLKYILREKARHSDLS